MEQLQQYLHSADFRQFLDTAGLLFILIAIVVGLIAMLLEIRLPIRYYWNLPGHSLKKLAHWLHLVKPDPIWGKSYVKSTGRPMPVVACELLDPTTNAVLMRTYTNHLGEYGFPLKPGKYLLRATKTHYRLPSILDPENVRVVGVDESFVVQVSVINKEVTPVVDLPLIPVKELKELSVWESIRHYARMFIFQLANALLALVILLSLVGLWVTREPFYGIIIAVSIVFLFIKLYVFETISAVTRS